MTLESKSNMFLSFFPKLGNNVNRESSIPSLIAVSKTKPFELVAEAYACEQRDFGENYVQELVEKAKRFKEVGQYDDIRWHFIGKLQRNKINHLLGVTNLECIQTVDSIKLIDALSNSLSKKREQKKLKVYIQINSSSEDSKGGCPPEQCVELVKHVISKEEYLQFEGLMTIGSFSHDYSKGPNPDFQCMLDCKERVCEQLQIDVDDVKLSMGMSNDYQQAILSGATAVRLGSTIFGARE